MAQPVSLATIGKALAPGKGQRFFLAVCILLGPIAFTLYVVSWNDVSHGLITTSAIAGAPVNLLHFTAGFAASFLLPIGYLSMAWLGLHRSPRLAACSALFALLGWLPLGALIAIDDLAYDIALRGNNTQLSALWTFFNGDPLMNAYLVVYAAGHLVSTVLIGLLLLRTRLVVAWTAWAFILSSPLTIVAFVNEQHYRAIVTPIICALLIPACVSAAWTMIKNHGQENDSSKEVIISL